MAFPCALFCFCMEVTMGTRDFTTIMLTGRVTAEPEMRFTAEGEPRTTFYLSCEGRTTTELLRLVAWGTPLAEACNEFIEGTRLFVEGQLQRCSADDANERTRFPLEVRVTSFIPLGPGDDAAMPVRTPTRPPAPPARAEVSVASKPHTRAAPQLTPVRLPIPTVTKRDVTRDETPALAEIR